MRPAAASAKILIVDDEQQRQLAAAQDAITEQKQAADSLREGAARLRSTLDRMLEGCQIIGPDWRYLYVNAAAAKHARRRPEELLGRTVMEMYPGIEQIEMFGFLRQCLEKRTASRIETEFIYPDGSKALFDLSMHPAPEGMLVLSYDITERKRLEKEILEISEREQSRIGQDLHDGLCQHLAGIEFRLLGLKQKLKGKASRHAAETAQIAKLVRDGIEQTRTLAHGLSPVMLETEGLANGLQELAINTENAFRISCSFNCPAPVVIRDSAVAMHLYRIAQEAVQNAIRHGKPKFIVINLVVQNERLVLSVKDDGVGFRVKPRKHHGIGLRVMQYRAGMSGGSVIVQRDPAGGTSVVCSLPVARLQRAAGTMGKRADQ
jgi:PAS domain S-box-containing protein